METVNINFCGRPFVMPKFYMGLLESMLGYEYKFSGINITDFEDRLILDIGGNVGLFSAMAVAQFKHVQVLAYEPEPENAALFRKNMGACENVHLIEAGVWKKAGKKTLRLSKDNPGAHSIKLPMFSPNGEVEIECVDAATLPVCTMIKLDTEGCEYEILKRYFDKVCNPVMVTYEYHSDEDMRKLDRLMRGAKWAQYVQCGGLRLSLNSGTACWIDLMKVNVEYWK